MEKGQTERTIYLKDLLFAALYRWKWIIAAMLVFGVLLGALELLQGSSVATLNALTLTPENQSKIEDLQDTVKYASVVVEKQEKYLQESALMQLDPYNVYTVGKYYHIALPEAMPEMDAQVEAIAKYYMAMTTSTGPAVQQLAQEMAVPEWVVRELITVKMDAGLQVFARSNTPEEAQRIAAAACADIEALAQTINEASPHSLSGKDFSKGPMLEDSVFDAQYSARQKLTTHRNSILSAETELKRLLPLELETSGKKVVLFAAVGAVLGACLAAGVVWVGHLGRGRVYSARTLKDHTGVQLLGCVCGRRKYDRLTRWLRKLEGRATCEKTDAVALNLANRCQQVKKLMLMGNYCPDDMEALVAALTEKGITCVVCGNPEETAQVFEALPECDGAVLVETCGSSQYEKVIWETEILRDYNKTLLGCILIGG